MNNHYAKFEYIKELNLFELQITHKLHNVSTPKFGVDIILSKFKTPKYILKCEQNIGCTWSMSEQ